MITALVTFFVVGLIGLAVLTAVLAVVGIVFSAALSLAAFLLFKVGPIILLGYLIVRFLAPRQRRLEKAEREWLEGA
ncbi:MAG TPA: hypothetical protein VKZ58_08910 [Longimicrobiales bacterium]|nr:hypothetical protein [Longimicrobiales bacterium]